MDAILQSHMDYCLKMIFDARSVKEADFWQEKLDQYRAVYLKKVTEDLEIL